MAEVKLFEQSGEKLSGIEGCGRILINRSQVSSLIHGLGGREVRQFFPEKFPAIKNFSAAHVEEVYGDHFVFVVVSEDIGIVTVNAGDPLLLLELLDGRNQITELGGSFELLHICRFGHAAAQ